MSNDVNQGMQLITIVSTERPTNNFRVVIAFEGQPPHTGMLQQEFIIEYGQRGQIGYRWSKEWRNVPVVVERS